MRARSDTWRSTAWLWPLGNASERRRKFRLNQTMYDLINHILRPYTLAFAITGLAIISLWHKRQASRGRLLLLTLGFAMTTAFNLPAMSHFALGSLEWSFPPLKALPDDVGAIVVLSGSWEPPDSIRLESQLGSDTLYRCLYAARLYHLKKPISVLVSGGPAEPGSRAQACAELMRDFLVQLAVDPSDLWVEANSRSTYENAVESRKVLERQGVRKILLVTEAWHMRRASLCFRRQGIDVVPAACHHYATNFESSAQDFLPSPDAAAGFSAVWHEWIGLAWYRLRGRF
jgi:uncharacterized SAM-binding protein YcdF (DUF218 family)